MEMYESLKERIDEDLADEKTREVVKRVFNSLYFTTQSKGEKILAEYKRKYREIKETSMNNLDKLIKQATESFEKNGTNVFIAETKEDAVKYVMDEVEGQEMVVKSKCNTAMEIGLFEAMENAEIEIIETDLGDRLMQILPEEKSSIPVAPAIHLGKDVVAFGLSKDLAIPVEPELDDIVYAGRIGLREKILNAKVGITGANAIAAEAGWIGLIENEGNISLITRLPEKHISIAGIDKIVPTLKDALHVIESAEMFLGVIGTYISFIRGPSRTGDVQGITTIPMHGAKEVHLVLVDDWRSKIIGSDFEDILYCMNCSGCFFSCPISFEAIIAFGKAFKGGVGIVKTAFMYGLEEAVAAGLFMCTECGSCKQNCPGEIDMPSMIEKLRVEAIEKGLVMPPHEAIVKSIKEHNNPLERPKEERQAWFES